MNKKPRISQDERDLFRASVPGVAPLKKPQETSQHPAAKKISRRFIPRAEREPDLAPLRDDPFMEPVHSEDYLSFAQTGLQYRTIQKLRRGEIAIDSLLDLHGLTVPQAERALQEFLLRASQQRWRCLCIIHGKAGRSEDNRPILKNKVNQWLRLHPDVLAFCSATPAHGGVGAVYILLKRASTFREK